MYSTEDFTELDKSNFSCYRFENGDIYYGEVGYMNPEKKLVSDPKDLEDEEIKPTLKLVRHGNGIQLFGINELKTECKYEGQWNLDKKEGRGTAHFKDGSIYEGDFINDLFDGIGKFIWRVGHVYIGGWKKGRMEGEGEFKHQDGHILRGTFINNYMFDKERGIFINPFLNVDATEDFRNESTKYSAVLKMNSKRFTKDNVKIVYGGDEIISLMDDSIKNNMTPLLIRTVERRVDKDEIFSYLPYEHVEIDLKYYYLELRKYPLDSEEINNVYEEIKSKFIDAMTNGKFLILNYDDCSVPYEELFEPDLKEITGYSMFNPLMWQPEVFAEPQNFTAHMGRRKELKYNPNFKFIVYSRYLITDVNADEEQLAKIIEKKFGKSFPLKYINIFVLSKPKPVPEPEKPAEEEAPKEKETVAQGKK